MKTNRSTFLKSSRIASVVLACAASAGAFAGGQASKASGVTVLTPAPSTVQSIDYQTRDVTLLGPEGKTFKLKAGPEIKRLNEVKQGDTVVARLTQAVSITVSTPGQK